MSTLTFLSLKRRTRKINQRGQEHVLNKQRGMGGRKRRTGHLHLVQTKKGNGTRVRLSLKRREGKAKLEGSAGFEETYAGAGPPPLGGVPKLRGFRSLPIYLTNLERYGH